MTIKLEYGKRYVTRDGQVTNPLCRCGVKHDSFKFQSVNCEIPDARWRENGTWSLDPNVTSGHDLVSEYVEPAPKFKPVDQWYIWADNRYPVAFVRHPDGTCENLNVNFEFKPCDNWGPSWEQQIEDGELVSVSVEEAKAHLRKPWANPGAKPSNPKDSIGVTKPPLSCVPCGPLFEIGAAMLDGSCKYGRHNYREIGVRASVYYDAMMRHIMKWWEGEERDKDSGCLHLAHAAACAIILMDCPDVNDDRPPVVGNPVDRVTTLVKEILGRYPEPVQPFVEKK